MCEEKEKQKTLMPSGSVMVVVGGEDDDDVALIVGLCRSLKGKF